MSIANVTYNTFAPLQDADYTLTARSIQTSGAGNGCVYTFICPKNYANGDVIRFTIASGATNALTSNTTYVGAQVTTIASGSWTTGTVVSNTALWPNNSATSSNPCTFANGSSTITLSPALGTALNVGEYVTFTTTGSLPANFAINTPYIVLTSTTTSVTVSATAGGTAITAGAGQSGTHNLVRLNTPVTTLLSFGMTTTAALTKGTTYALRVFPNTSYATPISFSAALASNFGSIQSLQEFHFNASTISTGQPNVSVGDSTQYYGTRCVRTTPQTSTTTNTTGTTQVAFTFALPSGATYLVNEVEVKGFTYSVGGTVTTGNITGRIIDSANTTIQSAVVVDVVNTVGTLTSARGVTFTFTTTASITGGTTYYFVIESISDKRLQYVEIDNPTDSQASGNGVVTNCSVLFRNATTGAWTDMTTSTVRAIPSAQITATVTDTTATGLAANPLAGYVR